MRQKKCWQGTDGKRMLEGMGKNTKVLHDYIKKENKRDNKVGPFKI